MSYIFGLVVVGLFFVALHYFTELKTAQKGGITLFFVLLVGGAIAFNEMQDAERAHLAAVELKYSQNKTIVCDGIDVNKSTFSFSVGTHTFIGRENTPHYNRMFSSGQCQ